MYTYVIRIAFCGAKVAVVHGSKLWVRRILEAAHLHGGLNNLLRGLKCGGEAELVCISRADWGVQEHRVKWRRPSCRVLFRVQDVSELRPKISIQTSNRTSQTNFPKNGLWPEAVNARQHNLNQGATLYVRLLQF